VARDDRPMHEGQDQGFFAWGQNPACSTSNAGKTRTAPLEARVDGDGEPLRQRDLELLEGPGVNPAM